MQFVSNTHRRAHDTQQQLMRRYSSYQRAVVVFALLQQLLARSTSITIDNTLPRRDTNGNILNAHDGAIVHDDASSLYWLVGTSYTHCQMDDANCCAGTCPSRNQSACAYPNGPSFVPNHPACGWTNNDFAAYSSPDLAAWTLRNPSLLPADARPNGVYFRPKLIRNPATRAWVLWFNFVTAGVACAASFPDCWSTYGTAVTAPGGSPAGPYALDRLPVRMGTGNLSVAHGDFALYGPDPGTGKAYILYNAYDHRGNGQPSNSVDELTANFSSSAAGEEAEAAVEAVTADSGGGGGGGGVWGGQPAAQPPSQPPSQPGGGSKWSGFFAGGDTGGDEAQVLLRRGAVYYAIIGADCCFCSRGSALAVYTAPSALGPWRRRGDINSGAARVLRGRPGSAEDGLVCAGIGGPEPPHRALNLSCVAPGAVIQEVLLASYGTMGCNFRAGNCEYDDEALVGLTTTGAVASPCSEAAVRAANRSANRRQPCFDGGSTARVAAACEGRPHCVLAQGDPALWPSDPCPGTYKSLYVQARCSSGAGVATALLPAGAGGLAIPAQQAFVLALPRPAGAEGGAEPAYLWAGDVWQSADDGFKSHDYQAWLPLAFNETTADIEPLQWADRWTLELELDDDGGDVMRGT
jgi:hypothetical protein